uniref:GTPase, IMAP family member 7 n=1 Tax=Pipistrellus kuhlii TaxID=59472 RepID=A0A7J7WL38_PIPKU|nr:GTPase, IMAP family member 7 [Pipistrellus kuhlii]
MEIGGKLQPQEEALKKFYADQLQKENKQIEEQCAKGKISAEEMERRKKYSDWRTIMKKLKILRRKLK